MNGALLRDAFDHHVWATLSLIDVCLELSDEQLQSTVPGTYGSILDTMRHLVGADQAYLGVLAGRDSSLDTDEADLAALRREVESLGAGWSSYLADEIDIDAVVTRVRADGSKSHAPVTIRLAQVPHHGTDHRSQICTALTQLGITPPEIDVWDYALTQGRLSEDPAPS